MAKKVRYEVVDDIDGTSIPDGEGESIDFTVGGVEYVIDLRAKNANEFHKKFDYYIEHSTRIGGRTRNTVAAGSRSPAATEPSGRRSAEHTREIRQWAADNGYQIGDRGRISAAIEDAFHAAH